MSEAHALDRPEILRVLFYPRLTGRSRPPAGAQDLDLTMDDGVVIGCRLFTAAKDAPLILFFHGNGETVPDYDDIGPHYAARQINFLVADYRGYGWSGGSPSVSTMIRDGRTIYRATRQWLEENGYSGKVLVMGRSLGSACAIDLAARYDAEISGLLIESGFAETIPLARTLGIDLAALGLEEKDGFNNLAGIEKVSKPTFILHGQKDTLIPLWQAHRLHAACGARSKELQIVPGADHNTLLAVAGVLYFQEIKRFVDRVTGSNDWRARRKQYQNQQKN
ncbi:MAG: alpha/beta hydrolase [Desulfobulbaceae bacterium]